tara:strand:- start:71 stop:646 length:576 start_codon:yes stop_codon:yes gene_type:complete
MALVIKGSSSGQVTVDVPAAAGTNTLTLPAGTGNIITSTTAGTIIQIVNNTVTALATGTTVFPRDDTIHQSNEGIEFMTLAITPTHASNKLLITARVMLGFTVADSVKMISLFQDSTANALATTTNFHHNATQMDTLHLSHYMAAGTTSATTFKIRGGCDRAGTTSFNGQSGARKYGGIDLSSITITEIAV